MSGVRTRRHGRVTVKVAGCPAIFELGPGEGTWTWDEIGGDLVEEIQISDRGAHLELVTGDDQPCAGGIEILDNQVFTDSTGAVGTVYDLLNFTGAFGAGTTTDPGGVVKTLEYLKFTKTRGAVVSTCTFPNVRLRAAYGEAKEGNKWSLKWTSYWTAGNPVVIA